MNDSSSWRELLRRSDWQGREQDFAGALRLAREGMEFAKREYGEESYEVAETWEYVAKAATFKQDDAAVTEAKEAAAKLLEKLESRNPPKASAAYASALIYQSTFFPGETGLPRLQEALSIQEKELGPNHISVGYTAGRIGHLCYLINESKKGLPYLEKALTILEQGLGSRHVDVATVLEDLANALQNAGAWGLPPGAPNPPTDPSQYSAEVRKFFERSVESYRRARTIREEHGEKDDTMYYLLVLEAEILEQLGRVQEAEPLRKRANATL